MIHLTPFFFRNLTRVAAVKHPELADKTVFGGPKMEMISFFTNAFKTSADAVFFAAAVGQPIRCSTAMGRNFFSNLRPWECASKVYIFGLEDSGRNAQRSSIRDKGLGPLEPLAAFDLFLNVSMDLRPQISANNELFCCLPIQVPNFVVECLHNPRPFLD